MKILINLASQPYLDLPRYLRRRLPWLAGFALLTLLFVSFSVHRWLQAGEVDRAIVAEQKQKSQLEAERAQTLAMLQRPENQGLIEQSQLINQAIARKDFSWTLFFMEMESILPQHLQLLSIEPSLAENGVITLRLRVAGDSHEAVLELLKRLESSPHFQHAELIAEAEDRSKGVATQVEYEIQVEYLTQTGGGKAAH